MIAPNELITDGLRAHVAAVFCRCGWIAVEMPNRTYYCENPLCVNNLRPFAVSLQICSLVGPENVA